MEERYEQHKQFTKTLNTVDECLQMIWMIGCDYDGYEDPQNLKDIIDELVAISFRARDLMRT